MILITVRTKVTPGSAEAYLAANRPFLEATRQEPGNKWFEQYRSVDDLDTILTSEAFDDAAAGEAHVKSDHFQQYLENDETKQYVAEVPDIIYVDIPDQDGWGKMAEF
ncbi:MAG: sle [Nocardioidaceae bacterium]|nr:sle [Nocardioidaceae bacterium]